MSSGQVFSEVNAATAFAHNEEEILSYWEKIDAFQTSLKKSEGKPEYSFYDGPPFATGLPHYGHILAGTIKDIVTRYAHQTGHHVDRRFGWDCHGVPIEFEIEKMLGIKTKEQIMELGIDKYNEHCRSIVMKYANEWRTIVTRLGRWIDFDRDYKTMNLSFMETEWWVFKQLWDKGLVYRGAKVMPYSVGCTTTLSNFEAGQNYQDVSDPAIMITFPIVGDKDNTKLVAWTTTPWTLPSNLALCCHPDLTYVKIIDNATNETYILLKDRLTELYKKGKDQYKILQEMKGTDLKGLKYVPLYNYFEEKFSKTAFRVICDTYVTNDSGTGIVHCAPGFGEDDWRVCLENGICEKSQVLCPIDECCRFLPEVPEYAGKFVKDCDKDIIKELKTRGRLISQGTIKHSYPFCWRSDTPLIYRAIPSWFVNVETLKPQLLANNKKSYWVPEAIQTKRFHNWLEDARDWAISRSRYWGTPIPIWVNDDYTEMRVIGSVAELEELTGQKITDIHKHHIDQLTILGKDGKTKLHRIPEVFDCWFESGSMPYAQQHYPFENKEKFHSTFPADFIAEGLDQTRGWFYTLLVLGTALFDECPFKNLIVNGLVLAEDGKKMSKRLKNYPEPTLVINKHGADALRLYLINSPVVRAESLKFKEKGVEEVVEDIFKPWANAYRFFVQNSNIYFRNLSKNGQKMFDSNEAEQISSKSDNMMDRWILSLSQSLIKFIREEMAAYRLYTVIPRLVTFINSLTNWYVRLNRPRLKGLKGEADWKNSLCTMYTVLYILCRAMAPFTPFLTEIMYQNLKKIVPENEREDSVHYLMIPEFKKEWINEDIERAVGILQQVCEAGRYLRDKKAIGNKFPIKEFVICHMDAQVLKDVETLRPYLEKELNTKSMKVISDVKGFMQLKATVNFAKLGKSLKDKMKAVTAEIAGLTHDQIVQFLNDKSIQLKAYDTPFGLDDIIVSSVFTGDNNKYESQSLGSGFVIMDFALDEDCIQEGLIRTLCSRVQQARKAAKLHPEDEIDVVIRVPNEAENALLVQSLANKAALLNKSLKGMKYEIVKNEEPVNREIIHTGEKSELGKSQFVQLYLCKP